MDRPAPLPADLVQQFVGVSHGDFEQVKLLLAQEPRLINAAWDWGGGDWETGLGAAAHTGQREIALFLLAHGARLDIFAAAMLGHLDIVQGILTTYPHLKDAPGPHGIPLLIHAQYGGEPALPVLHYLQSLA